MKQGTQVGVHLKQTPWGNSKVRIPIISEVNVWLEGAKNRMKAHVYWTKEKQDRKEQGDLDQFSEFKNAFISFYMLARYMMNNNNIC